MKARIILVTLSGLLAAGLVVAATQTIDGANITQAVWGVAPVAEQDTNTRFGDNFNELNLFFIDSDNDNVYLGIPGNIADNNALTIFIDTDAGGSNVLNTEPGGGCPGSVPTLIRIYNDTVLETGLAPEYALLISVGIFPGQSTSQLVFASDLTNLNTLANVSLGIAAVGDASGNLTGTPVHGVRIAINNTNGAGVRAWDPNQPCADPADPETATTGYEVAIPRSLLGLTGQTARNVSFFAYISNNGQDSLDGVCFGRAAYGSNQGLPGLACADNLALFSGVSEVLDFTDPNSAPGTQVVTVSIPGVP